MDSVTVRPAFDVQRTKGGKFIVREQILEEVRKGNEVVSVRPLFKPDILGRFATEQEAQDAMIHEMLRRVWGD